MSEIKPISPLLDGFAIGESMCSHDGVSCYPAMPVDSDDKYIVKVVSIPASDLQFNAFLLSRVYPTREKTLEYFRDMANSVVHEAEALQHLSRFGEFVSYEKWQVEPKENGCGYDVYLLGTFKRSLQKKMTRDPLTQLEAVNLGLDMCAALTTARNAGCLCVDVKPSNIFVGEDGKFRLGDLGYIPLSCLSYSSLPDRYRSEFTAPELSDPLAPISKTADVFSLGLILYAVFNNGELPRISADTQVPPPQYADYELADIILKAVSPDPAMRWEDPKQMGQFLVSYMQRNPVNDTPIIPVHVDTSDFEPESPVDPEEMEKMIASQMPELVAEEIPASEEISTQPEEAIPAQMPEAVPESEELPEIETVESPVEEQNEEEMAPVESEEEVPEEVPEEKPEEIPEELKFLNDLVSDDTAPSEDMADSVTHEEISDDTAMMLSQLDELVSHDAPSPVVVPEPIDVPMPEPIVLEPEEPEKSEEVPESETEVPEETNEPVLPPKTDEEKYGYEPETKKSGAKGFFITLLVLVILLAGLFCVYKFYYQQSVDSLSVDVNQTSVTIQVKTAIPEEKLHIVCTDAYGNSRTAEVQNGVAVIDDLTPDTLYQVKLTMDGYHEIVGAQSATFSTLAGTNIMNLVAATGADSSTAIISFSVDGVDCEEWTVSYVCEGEEPKSETFNGHLVSITGLSSGKTYTISVVPNADTLFTGTNEITFVPTEIVYAESVMAKHDNGTITVTWSAPEDSNVESWSVHCFSDSGYDQVANVTDMACEFTGIEKEQVYVIEITASGMTQSVRTNISTAARLVNSFNVRDVNGHKISLSIDADAEINEGDGIILKYSIDGLEQQPIVVTENDITISPVVPNSNYDLSLYSKDGSPLPVEKVSVSVPGVDNFSQFGTSYYSITIFMLRTPDIENWSVSDVYGSDYTTSFDPGEKASYIFFNRAEATEDKADVELIFATYSDDTLVNLETSTVKWEEMWSNGYAPIDIMKMPTAPGSYHMNIYMGGEFLNTIYFSIN